MDSGLALQAVAEPASSPSRLSTASTERAIWAVVEKWYAGAYEGFGVLITEECEEVIARDAVVESEIPLKAGDRVLIDYVAGADGAATVKLVKVQQGRITEFTGWRSQALRDTPNSIAE